MANSTVTGVRSIELGVRDLHQSAEFYTKVWALEEVSAQATPCISAPPAASIMC
jgi:catechol-2,3-dioxygenase